MGAACSHACSECPSFRDVWADCPDAQLRQRGAVARLRARQYDPRQPVFARGHMCFDRLTCRCAYVRCLASPGARRRLHARVGHCRAFLFGMLYRRALLTRCLVSLGARRRLHAQVGHCHVLLFGMPYRRALLARCLASPGARWCLRARVGHCRALLFGMLYRRALLARCLAPDALRRLHVQVGHCHVLLFGMLCRRALLARCLASSGALRRYRAKSACCRAHHALMPHCHALSVHRTARRDDLWLHLGYARLARQFGVHGGLCIHLRSALTPSAQC